MFAKTRGRAWRVAQRPFDNDHAMSTQIVGEVQQDPRRSEQQAVPPWRLRRW